MSDFEILVDCDAFVGLFFPDDEHHAKCLPLFENFAKQRLNLATTNYTIAETATVLSRHAGQPIAKGFLDYIASGVFPVIYIDRTLHEMANSIFREQQNKNTSLFDCTNVAVMQTFGIPSIFSFDKAYKKRFKVQIAHERW